MKTKRIVWTIVFLGITLAAIVMEVVAGIFHPAGTIPWTEYLAKYVPWPIQLTAYVILAVWLPFHFWRHDHLRKVAYRQGHTDGKQAARQERLNLLREMRSNGAGMPKCSHGYTFGSPDSHHCGELPSDARS